MSIDVADLLAFYASPTGEVARAAIARAAAASWPNLRGLSVLGLGYATPFLPPREACERALAFMPGRQGVVNWPSCGRSASSLVDPLVLPLADASVDRVLAVHALEAVDHPDEFLHEIWRVLTAGGRLMIVCPNRRGVWARMDRTPFGYGQPYSRSQLKHLLRATHFAPERWTETLYVPPFRSRMMLRAAPIWDGIGRGLSLPFAGLHVVEATKQVRRAVAVKASSRARARRPALVPARPRPEIARDSGGGRMALDNRTPEF